MIGPCRLRLERAAGRWHPRGFAVQSGMAPERDEADERIARIEQLIDEYHATKNREVLQRARRLWRQAEVAQALQMQKIRAQIH
jgi:hypothetical protein